MKLKISIGVLCVAAMLLSVSSFASATAPREEISENAGQTIGVLLVEDTDNGMTSHVIKAYIPEGATKAEEDAITRAAVLPTVPYGMESTNDWEYLSTEYDLVIGNYRQEVGGGTLEQTLKTFYVQFSHLFSRDYLTDTTLYINLKNLTTGKSQTKSLYMDINDAQLVRSVYYAYNRGDMALNAGDQIVAEAYTVGASVQAEYCQLFGTDAALG